MQVLLRCAVKWIRLFALCVLTLEICARLDDGLRYAAPLLGPYTSERLRAVDADGIQHNVANARFEKWRHNRYGFRGSEIGLQKQPGVQRVVCMGTSESYGLSEGAGQEWPAQLADSLAGRGGFEVINASVVGLPMHKFAAYLDHYVLRFQPDIVVLVINPFAYLTAPRTNSGQALRVNGPGAPQRGPISRTLGLLRVYPKIRQTGRRLLPSGLVRGFLERRAEQRVAAETAKRLGGRPLMDAVPDSLLAQYHDDLLELTAHLIDRDIQVVYVTYPTLLSRDDLSDEREAVLNERRYFVTYSEAGLRDVARRFAVATRQFAAECDRPLVDIAGSMPVDRRHFFDAVHYTPAGAALMAHETAAVLRDLVK